MILTERYILLKKLSLLYHVYAILCKDFVIIFSMKNAKNLVFFVKFNFICMCCRLLLELKKKIMFNVICRNKNICYEIIDILSEIDTFRLSLDTDKIIIIYNTII